MTTIHKIITDMSRQGTSTPCLHYALRELREHHNWTLTREKWMQLTDSSSFESYKMLRAVLIQINRMNSVESKYKDN